jgi:hypothetical protein
MEFKSKNPFLSNKSFSKATSVHDAQGNVLVDYNNTMTVNGAVNKSFILLLLLLTGAFTVWYLAVNGTNPMPIAIGGTIIALISLIVASVKPEWAFSSCLCFISGPVHWRNNTFYQLNVPGCCDTGSERYIRNVCGMLCTIQIQDRKGN